MSRLHDPLYAEHRFIAGTGRGSRSVSSTDRDSPITVDNAIAAFQAGGPVLIHDGPESEGRTDLTYPAGAISPASVARLRNDAGALVCVAVADRIARQWELPFVQDAFDHPATANHDLGYDERSSVSLTVNIRTAYTGITDEDRAPSISTIGAAAEPPMAIDFPDVFRTPDHVHLLRAALDLLADRKGQTEVGIPLAERAALPPAVVKEYAGRNNCPSLSGDQLSEYVKSQPDCGG